MTIDKTPDQLKMDYALWTRKAVMELIRQVTALDMPVWTAGDYSKRWGYYPKSLYRKHMSKAKRQFRNGLMKNIQKIKAKAKIEKPGLMPGGLSTP